MSPLQKTTRGRRGRNNQAIKEESWLLGQFGSNELKGMVLYMTKGLKHNPFDHPSVVILSGLEDKYELRPVP